MIKSNSAEISCDSYSRHSQPLINSLWLTALGMVFLTLSLVYGTTMSDLYVLGWKVYPGWSPMQLTWWTHGHYRVAQIHKCADSILGAQPTSPVNGQFISKLQALTILRGHMDEPCCGPVFVCAYSHHCLFDSLKYTVMDLSLASRQNWCLESTERF